MKIVCVAYLHGSGGAERQITMLANALCTRGYEVYLAVLAEYNRKYEISRGVTVCDLTYVEKKKNRFFQRGKALCRLYEDIQPDVTIHYWLQSAYLTAFMHKEKYGKIIYSERGDPGDKEYSGALGLIRNAALPMIDGFVFQSKGARDYFNKKVQLRSVIVPNPVYVKAEDYPKVNERRKTLVNVGRLHPQKNQKLLIDAFAHIAEDIPEYTLEIYGEGELKDELQNQINYLGLSNRVFLKGTSREIHQVIYDASLFVLSSDYEGLPNALMEAEALGIPCISTDCRPGGAQEIITQGYNGEIVRCNDKVALANSILKLLNDDVMMKKYSINGIIDAKRFAPIKIYDAWEKFIKNVVEN